MHKNVWPAEFGVMVCYGDLIPIENPPGSLTGGFLFDLFVGRRSNLGLVDLRKDANTRVETMRIFVFQMPSLACAATMDTFYVTHSYIASR